MKTSAKIQKILGSAKKYFTMSKKVCTFAPDFLTCPGGGMVDTVDSKSAARKGVRVQVPPGVPRALNISALTFFQIYSRKTRAFFTGFCDLRFYKVKFFHFLSHAILEGFKFHFYISIGSPRKCGSWRKRRSNAILVRASHSLTRNLSAIERMAISSALKATASTPTRLAI